jgi:hypothetical protein
MYRTFRQYCVHLSKISCILTKIWSTVLFCYEVFPNDSSQCHGFSNHSEGYLRYIFSLYVFDVHLIISSYSVNILWMFYKHLKWEVQNWTWYFFPQPIFNSPQQHCFQILVDVSTICLLSCIREPGVSCTCSLLVTSYIQQVT